MAVISTKTEEDGYVTIHTHSSPDSSDFIIATSTGSFSGEVLTKERVEDRAPGASKKRGSGAPRQTAAEPGKKRGQ